MSRAGITHEQYVTKLKLINPTIKALGRYVRCTDRILHQCTICNHKWQALVGNLTHKTTPSKCPQCLKRKQLIPKSAYLRLLNERYNNDIVLTDHYIDKHTNTKHQCNVCNHVWSSKPKNLLINSGCPQCIITKSRLDRKLSFSEISRRLFEKHGNSLIL